jgi:3-oxoacyl-[acyl-carrier-protein] synthase II
MRDAGAHISEVDYINVHGTASDFNDNAETTAIKRTFGNRAKRIAISSTKPITGHLLGAAGAIETIVCALSIKNETIPPTINLDCPAAGCDLDYVPKKSRAYPVRVALNLNSGFGGKNSCLVLRGFQS